MTMTLEEIRREKKVAEEAIKDILRVLQKRTGLYPELVDVNPIEVHNIEDRSSWRQVSSVQILMESI
jgi:hypothetical protein